MSEVEEERGRLGGEAERGGHVLIGGAAAGWLLVLWGVRGV